MAVHSVADSMGLFVKMADEAINIGPAPERYGPIILNSCILPSFLFSESLTW